MQLNLSTVATLGTEESGCCRKALNKSQCMDLLSARTKKLAFVERWPLVEVRLYSGGGGPFRNFWVGMCRWDRGTLDLYQS